MKCGQFFSRLRRHCRKNGLVLVVDEGRGKGSHVKVTVGRRSTIVKSGELAPRYISAVLKQLALPPGAV